MGSRKVFGTSKLSEVAPETRFVSRIPRLNFFFFFFFGLSCAHNPAYRNIRSTRCVLCVNIFLIEGIRDPDVGQRTPHSEQRAPDIPLNPPSEYPDANRSHTLEEVQTLWSRMSLEKLLDIILVDLLPLKELLQYLTHELLKHNL